MKTKPMAHQAEALQRSAGRDGYALFMDMGTGKTWTLLAEAEQEFLDGFIEGVIVIAPKGVHTNWVRREIPAHLEVPHMAVSYRAGAGKHETERMMRILRRPEQRTLRILSINIESVSLKKPFDLLVQFIKSLHGVAILVDESDLIKNPRAARTKAIMTLKRAAGNVMRMRKARFYRRIATGTPAPQSPLDLFAQMEFLDEGLLGTTSYRAFVAEFAETLPDDHRLVERITRQQIASNPWAAKKAAKGEYEGPQIIARDPITNAPRYRNLDRLSALIQPHSYRVRKEDCLDLPPKVYKTHYFDLTPTQRAMYDRVEKDARIELAAGEVTVFRGGNMLGKLQQITSGYVIVDGEPRDLPIDGNPRAEALEHVVAYAPHPMIIFAWYIEELNLVTQMMRRLGLRTAEYRGGVKERDREAAVDGFQNGELDSLVAQQASGGVGLTLTRAKTVIYFSNSFSSRIRLQSEDRPHRKGLEHSVLYIDLAAVDTVDEAIATAHQRKVSVARQLLDHRGLPIPVPEDQNQPRFV